VTTPGAALSLDPYFQNHGDPALEAFLPDNINGTPLVRYSLTLEQLFEQGGDEETITAFLTTLGKTPADGSYAGAHDPSGVVGGGINAFKVAGADATLLLAGITELEKSDLGESATTTQATVGGKNVTVLSVGSEVNDTVWLYGYGDVVFVVHAANEAEPAAYLATLP